MSNTSLFNAAVDVASRIWEMEPVREVRMPVLESQGTVTIDALWTDGGLRPNSSNLAFLIQRVSNSVELERWKQRLKAWPIRGGLLVASEELHLFQPRSESSSEFKHEALSLDSWHEMLGLVSPKPHLL